MQVYIGNILPQIPQIVADFNRTEIIIIIQKFNPEILILKTTYTTNTTNTTVHRFHRLHGFLCG